MQTKTAMMETSWRAAAQTRGGHSHQWLCLFLSRQGNERLCSQISTTKQMGMFTQEIRWWLSLSVPSMPYGVMHYDNLDDESQFNASMNFIKALMHKNPFCYDAARCGFMFISALSHIKNPCFFIWIRLRHCTPYIMSIGCGFSCFILSLFIAICALKSMAAECAKIRCERFTGFIERCTNWEISSWNVAWHFRRLDMSPQQRIIIYTAWRVREHHMNTGLTKTPKVKAHCRGVTALIIKSTHGL